MENKFKRWETEDETRALLLRHCNLEDQVCDRRSDARYLQYKKELVLRKTGNVKIDFGNWERAEKEEKEKISDIEEKLKIMHAELEEDPDLKEFMQGCGEGIICETADEVRALYRLKLYTFPSKMCVGVYQNCPNMKEILAEAQRWRVKAKPLAEDETGTGVQDQTTTNARREGSMVPPFINWKAETRRKLLAVIGLEKEIERRTDQLCQLIRRRMERGFELEELQNEVKRLETLEADCKEFIEKAEEDLKILEEEIKQKKLSETFLSERGKGMLCENVDDVRAFYTMTKLICILREVFVDTACPNFKQVVQAAEERMLVVFPFRASKKL